METKRITPAWSGKSVLYPLFMMTGEDHPRVGGEKFGVVIRIIAAVGSPPRGRGKVRAVTLNMRLSGITPAWAGKRYRLPSLCSGMKDHPRVGGEKAETAQDTGSCKGSPPRGRGKADQRQDGGRARGITPAWAGKSRK